MHMSHAKTFAGDERKVWLEIRLHHYFIFVSAIYSRGPQSHLFHGVMEQNAIFHVMDYALCLSDSKKSLCESQGLNKPSRGNISNWTSCNFVIILFVTASLLMNILTM